MSKPRGKNRIGSTLQRGLMTFHINFYRLTGGKMGGKAGQRAFLLLTTAGRKSGQARVTPLFYHPDGDRYLLIASNWGAQNHPVWWLNLQKKPDASIQIGRKIIAVTAHQAEGEERQRLWEEITRIYSNFAAYQEKITREIPVVILTPVHKTNA